MAEAAGFVASIAQIASSGIQLSSVLYDSARGAARADQEATDIADHVKTTAVALDGVARIVAQEDGPRDVSRTALSEADDLAKRCEAVFADVQDFIAKRKTPGHDKSKSSPAYEQSKEQRSELLRRRLDSLKHSILLLLHVLQLANAQAKGNVDSNLIAQEREAIRELHQRQQDALKALQALESNLGDVFFSDDETLNGSAAPSRVPTINFLVHSSVRGVSSDRKPSGPDRSREQAPGALGDKPETTDSNSSDETVTDDDEDLTVNELAHCATHAQKFAKRITALQQSGHVHSNGRFPRNRVLKLYRRFCRKFEATMSAHESATPTVASLPPAQYTYQLSQRMHPHSTARDPQRPTQQAPTTLPDPSAIAADRVTHSQSHLQTQQNSTRTARPPVESQHALAAPPAWTISSEPLGPGSRPKLPPLISSVAAVPRASHASPTNDTMSPLDDHDARYSGTDGDGDHGSHETGPVVYTKTGRISKAKKGLKVHVCEECGRSFTRAEHLRRHQKNHGPNQVRCELCGKVFFRADLLQRHLERHKDPPQSYQFSNAPNTESASPVAENQHHRHILPTPETVRHVIPPQHSPSDRSVNSSVASGAPTPSDAPAASPAVISRPHSAWETARTQTAASHAVEDVAAQRTHAWQTVNAQERRHFDTSHAHASSPSTQQSHPGLPKLQPKADPANGVSAHKRYSNILPAPGAANSQNQHANYPQEHMPTMVLAHNQVPPVQAVLKAAASPVVHQNYHQTAQDQGPQPSTLRQDGHAIPRSPVVSTRSGSALASYSDQSHISRSVPANTSGLASNTTIGSGNVSSDKEGVNWRLAETDAQPYRKRKHYRTVSQTDGESSGIDDRGSGHVTHRTPEIFDRSRPGSHSLSLVMPQDDRDHALLEASRPENRQVAELVSPHGAPSTTALSPSLGQRRSTSRPSTGTSEPTNLQAGKATSGPESPEPESPYSLATINRYIQNQGPQPGVQDDATAAVSPQISVNPCERCREYSIRCDGKLPSCTACATTKYAGECSFASMSAHPTHLVGANTGPPGTKFYGDMSGMTGHAMAEPPAQLLQPPVAANPPRAQEYNSEEDLPSPYLKAHDKGQSTAHIPCTSLDADVAGQASRKRKADGAQNDYREGGAAHERKRSKGESADPGKGKDIVNLLLKKWTLPMS